MKTITLTLPDHTPMIAIAKFAAELGCDTAFDGDTDDWIFTQARDPLPPVDTQALKDELNEMRRKYVELSKAVNDLVNSDDEGMDAHIFALRLSL